MARRKNTRNAQGSGTIRKRNDGRWEARYTTGKDPATGKQIQRSIYGQTQEAVSKKLRLATVGIDTGTYVEPSKLTVSEWVSIWLDDYCLDLKPLTMRAYRSQVDNHILPAFGKVKLSALKPHHIQAFYKKLQDYLSAKTIKNIHGIFHKALQQAVKSAYIAVNPADACKLPKVVKTGIAPLDSSELPAFMEAIKGDPFESLFLIDVLTGLRQSEIIGLSWDCINFKQGTIYIYRQLQRHVGSYEFAPLKNDKTRTIAPAALVIDTLKALKVKQLEDKLKAGSAWMNGDNLIFTNEVGEHLYHPTILKHFKKIVDSLGRPEMRFHDLRHSYAVLSIQAGDDFKTIQENMGHHSVSFTMDTYASITDAMRKTSSQRMDNLIKML